MNSPTSWSSSARIVSAKSWKNSPSPQRKRAVSTPVRTVTSERPIRIVSSMVRVAQPTVSPASQSQYCSRSAIVVT